MAAKFDEREPIAPREPIQTLTDPIQRFLHVEQAGGIVLFAAALVALVLANSPLTEAWLAFWKTPVGLRFGDFQLLNTLKHWVNDGLMVLFFFVMGLEVKRELVLGELRQPRRAALPLAGALGGMIVPAGVYVALQWGAPGQRGWGVPMATDIAFLVGCMAMLGSRVPASLRIMLLTLAIVDDIGAILVVAFGYTKSIQPSWLFVGGVAIGMVALMQAVGVRSLLAYVIVGLVVWLGFHESGVHATLAGVILGLLTPTSPYLAGGAAGKLVQRIGGLFRPDAADDRAGAVLEKRWLLRETVSPLDFLIHLLHPWVAFVIMPVFALANAGVTITPSDLVSPVALAVIAGLTLGKPAGVMLCSWLAVKSGIAERPAGVSWTHLLGGGMLTGIGFTMSLFIAGLALEDEALRGAKIGVLAASVLSATAGLITLRHFAPAPGTNQGA
jgi:NhaA family Na+:H+ antiporter